MSLSVKRFLFHYQMLADQKIASMVECKDFRKGIIRLEWEHKMKRMKIEDLNNKARDLQMLRLTEEQQDVSVIRILKHPNTVTDLNIHQLASVTIQDLNDTF